MPIPPDRPFALEVLDLAKRFGPLEVLKGVSLSAGEGDVVAVIGASGAGKSTLLRCLNLLEIPDSGRLIVHGEEINLGGGGWFGARRPSRRQADRLRRRVGMVFQEFNLWTHKTVLENVIEAPIHVLGRPREQAIEQAWALLDTLGIRSKAASYPHAISGGERQRAAIARTLAMDPRVILFDEPTSALDPERAGEVQAVIRMLAAEGRTMIVVTHEMAFAREIATEVVFLHEGRVEERGSPAALLDAPAGERARQFLSRHLSRAA